MIGFVKHRVAAWIVSRGVSDALKWAGVDHKPHRDRVVTATKKVVKTVMKKEPVLLGGIVTVLVALASAFGLDLTAEQLGVTISTLIAIISFIQRQFVSPVEK
jgi:hypothetical protein